MSDQKYTICLISPSLQMGGLERAMSNLANYFCSKGHTIYYITLYRFKKFYELDERIKVIEPNFAYKSTPKFYYYLKLLRYIRTQVTAHPSDTILSFGDYHNAWVLLALRGLQVPVYVSDRSSPDKDFGRIFTHFKKWTYKWSAGIAAQTSRAAAQKKKLLGENVRINIIPNTVRRIDAPESEREGFILGVGRHYHVKGFDRLLEAFARLKTDWKLLLAGDGGPESKNLREQAKHLGIDERVIFLGKVTDMDSVYARASIFALTSRSEGFPNALCEAMAAGLVCVSYDISAGPADIITDKENGFLVQDGNIEALVSTIEMLMNQPDLRKEIGSKARLIQNELSFEKNGNKFLEFITSHIDRSC